MMGGSSGKLRFEGTAASIAGVTTKE
uniref:Uncharacterized protein n=1 Tax=Rhizophora mucronata TaxID=61149 RepID=A0A2P2PXT7_RHIMU